jgi:hypothetical protein
MSAPDHPISLSTVVVADDRQVSVDLGDETLVLHMETGGYYSLRKVAAEIWEQLKSPVTAGRIAENLSRRYGIPNERCGEDLLELLADLRKRDLVRIVHAEGSKDVGECPQ